MWQRFFKGALLFKLELKLSHYIDHFDIRMMEIGSAAKTG